ncbi:MAG: DUF1538 domain-containing protein [Bauldia sp.]|nr:DUF1538 domain-containing protein [Bauldia sp.]
MGTIPLSDLGGIAVDVVAAIVPLIALFLVFQIAFLRIPWRDVAGMVIGLAIAAVGLLLFLAGVAVAYVPFGRAIGTALASLEWSWMVGLVGLVLGLVTAWGEPAIRILADQVEEASSGSITHGLVVAAICVGVAVAGAVGLLRIVYGIPILYILVPGYLLVILVMWFSERDFVAIAVDAGGVATGPLANTFLLAVALGTSASLGDGNALVGGFGLAALISVAPIVSVMIVGLLVRQKQRQGSEEP